MGHKGKPSGLTRTTALAQHWSVFSVRSFSFMLREELGRTGGELVWGCSGFNVGFKGLRGVVTICYHSSVISLVHLFGPGHVLFYFLFYSPWAAGWLWGLALPFGVFVLGCSSHGSVTVKVLPLPGPALMTSTVPLCISARRRAKVNPIPSPP